MPNLFRFIEFWIIFSITIVYIFRNHYYFSGWLLYCFLLKHFMSNELKNFWLFNRIVNQLLHNSLQRFTKYWSPPTLCHWWKSPLFYISCCLTQFSFWLCLRLMSKIHWKLFRLCTVTLNIRGLKTKWNIFFPFFV